MAPLLWSFVLRDYQKKRIAVFLGQGDQKKEGYQIEQATIAIGSGGMYALSAAKMWFSSGEHRAAWRIFLVSILSTAEFQLLGILASQAWAHLDHVTFTGVFRFYLSTGETFGFACIATKPGAPAIP